MAKPQLPPRSITPTNTNQSRNANIESLPVELVSTILRTISDLSTLSAIVHASPRIHATYLTQREEILTLTTLRELARYNIIIEQPTPFHTHVIRICQRPDLVKPHPNRSHSAWYNYRYKRNLVTATDTCRQQRLQGLRSKLSVELCIALYGCRQRGMMQLLFLPGEGTCLELDTRDLDGSGSNMLVIP